MKKLLCVLMVGMMVGQAELTTRVYTINNVEQYEIINLIDLTGFESDWYGIKVLNVNSSMNWNHASVKCTDQFGDYQSYATRLDRNIDDGRLYYNSYHMGQLGCFEPYLIVDVETYGDYLNDVECKLAITAEFPQEDTGYIEDGFDYCLHTGANLVSSPCRDAVAITTAIPSDIAQNITGIITEGGAASNLNGTWVGSINGLGGGKGYWIISEVAGCFNYTCSEN